MKNCTVNCELNSEPVFASLPIKKLSKTQRDRVSLQFTDRVFGIIEKKKKECSELKVLLSSSNNHLRTFPIPINSKLDHTVTKTQKTIK